MDYVADFETLVPPAEVLKRLDRKKFKKNYLTKSQIETWVWGYGLCKVGDVDDDKIQIGNSIDDFMEKVMKLKNPKIYFHNLKFDGHFILSWAFKNGYTMDMEGTKQDKTINVLISNMNAFYKIELIHKRRNKGYVKTVFQDSFKKLPFSVDRIGHAFGLKFKKLEVDKDFYKLYRSKNHDLTELEKEYIRNDIRVISQALDIQFKQGLTKMTVGSDAINEYKKTINNMFDRWFPVLSLDINSQILMAYRGGWVYASDLYKNKEVGFGRVYDVNSLYPSQMRNQIMPYGKPLFYTGKFKQFEDYCLYIQEITCEFKLKKDHLPTIQVKGDSFRYNPTEYLKESKGITKLHLTNMDLEMFLKHYDVSNLVYECGLMFRGKEGMFTEYIDKWNSVKETSEGAMRELAKLLLNSLYGKFGTKPNVTGKYAYFEEDIVKLALGEEEIRDPVYTAVAVFTTSYGRYLTISAAQENYHSFAYADTDSIHLVGKKEPNIETHKSHIGKWKLEGEFNWAKFIGAKCYTENMLNKKTGEYELNVTVAGMPKNMHSMVTKENFREGLVLSGKLMPVVVNGGVVLVDKEYTMKVRSFGTF